MIGRKGKFRNFQDSLLIWIGLSVASFVLSPITTYALCIVLFIFNAVMYMFSMAIDDMEGKTFVDHWTPVFPKMSFTIVGFITWIFITIILFYEYYVDNKRIKERQQRQKEKEEQLKLARQRLQQQQQQFAAPLASPPTPLPPPKPALSQMILPKAPNASVKKYYCLDDGLTTKTWLAMSEVKYYVNTLSLKKLLLLDGKNIVCRVYTKGQWTSHSITRINCDDNGKLSFGRTTKITT